MAERVTCDLCERELDVHSSYVVRMDVFADPSIPPMTSEEIAAVDLDQAVQELIEQTQGWTEEELQDTVHRRFEFRLCPRCHRDFLANPLGRPRVVREGTN
jgi:hypothetical protein